MSKNTNKEPEYILSSINTPLLNYKVYKMHAKEKMLYGLIGLVAGGMLGILFYGGLFKDEEGLATMYTYIADLVVFLLVGIIVAKLFLQIMTNTLKNKRTAKLRVQFRDFLSALSNSMATGMNVNDSLEAAYGDLSVQYSKDSYIAIEIAELINGIRNNIPIEDSIMSLGERSGIDDISNFGVVFSVCYRTGGNIKDIVKRTTDIISEKMIISEEIQTKITSNKMQLNVMMVIPIVIMLMLKSMSSDFAKSYATPVGIVCITVALGCFIGAYMVGTKIMDIKG